MATHSSKSQLEKTHFDDVHHTPPSLRVTITKKNNSKNKKRRKKNSLLNSNKKAYLGTKLGQLMKVFTPIPSKPLDLSSFSTTQENLLKRAGLWDFLNLKFDPELRSDLIAELIVGYNPQAPQYSRSFVNGRPVMLTKPEFGSALALPSRSLRWKKAAVKEDERFCGFEVISDEEVLFLENVVLKSVVLCGGEDDMDDDVLEVIKFMKEERRPELVDWRGLIWVMVEKELEKGVELRDCYYASHLEWFLRKQMPNLFVKEVGKLGFDVLGVKKLRLGIFEVDEKENKKVKGVVGYQCRKRKSGEMVSSEGEDLKGEKGSGLDLGCVEGGNVVISEVAIFGENQLGGSFFGHVEGKNEEKLKVGNFDGYPNESVVGDLWEEGVDSVGRKSGADVDSVEEVIIEGLMGSKNVKGELILMQDSKESKTDCMCLMKGGEDEGIESIGLIAEVGNEEDCKVDHSFQSECMVDLEVCGSDDAYNIDIGNEESGHLVQSSEQDNVADEKISGADLVTVHGKNNVAGEERSGVNGGKVDDQPLFELENDKGRLSSVQDGNVCVLVGECLMNESEKRGGGGENDNISLMTGNGKEDESMADFTEEGGDTEIGGYDDICAMELDEGKGEEDSVAELDKKGSYDVVVKQMETELGDCLIEQGKDDQLMLHVLVEDEGLIIVETKIERQEIKEKQMEYEPIRLTQEKSDVQMLVVSEKEVEDQSLYLCSLQGEMKMGGSLKEGEDIKMSFADDDRGGEGQDYNMCLITGEGKEDESKVDFSVEGGDTEMGCDDDICAMELGKGKSESLVQRGEEDNVADVNMEGSYDDDVSQMENKLADCLTKDLEIGKASDVQMLVVSEKEVEDKSLHLCLLQGEMKMEGWLKEREDISLEHGNSVREVQEKSMLLRKCEKAKVIGPADFGKQDSSVVDVELTSFGTSSGNHLDSAQIDLCTTQTGENDFIEVVKEENIVDYEDSKEKYKKQELFHQHCSPNMDAEYESGKAVEVREDIVEIKDIEDQDKESSFQHCSPNTDTLSDSEKSEKAVKISDEDSPPHGIVNDFSVVEPFVSGTSKGLEDFSAWGEQVDYWLGETKMVVAAKEEAWLNATMEKQMLSKKLEERDNMIHLLEKTKLEELRRRKSKINCLENELFFMANQIDHYKKALETSRKTFAAWREHCKLPEEPLYNDIPENGGIVLSTNEWEKERLRREQEERNSRLDTMITTFQLHWFDQFEGCKKEIKTLGDRLSDVENGVENLKNTFQNMIFGE